MARFSSTCTSFLDLAAGAAASDRKIFLMYLIEMALLESRRLDYVAHTVGTANAPVLPPTV